MQGRTFLHLRLRTWVLLTVTVAIGFVWWFGSPRIYGNSNQRVCAEKVVHYPSENAATKDMIKHFPIPAPDTRTIPTTRYNDYRFINDTTVVYYDTACPWWQKSYVNPGYARLAYLPTAWGLIVACLLLNTSLMLFELAKLYCARDDVLEDETALRETYGRYIADHHGLSIVVNLTEQALGDDAFEAEKPETSSSKDK